MAKVTFTFEDAEEGVAFRADFDPRIEELEADEKGMLSLTPAQNVADRVFAFLTNSQPIPGQEGCSGGCPDCPCRS